MPGFFLGRATGIKEKGGYESIRFRTSRAVNTREGEKEILQELNSFSPSLLLKNFPDAMP